MYEVRLGATQECLESKAQVDVFVYVFVVIAGLSAERCCPGCSLVEFPFSSPVVVAGLLMYTVSGDCYIEVMVVAIPTRVIMVTLARVMLILVTTVMTIVILMVETAMTFVDLGARWSSTTAHRTKTKIRWRCKPTQSRPSLPRTPRSTASRARYVRLPLVAHCVILLRLFLA